MTILTAVDGGRNRAWWIALAASLAAFLALAIGLTVTAAGPGPGLAASAAPPSKTPMACPTDTACVELAIVGPPLTDAQKAAAQPRSDAILRAVSSIDWRGHQQLREDDVAVVRAALARAGFPDAEVTFRQTLIRYVVPVLPACVAGYLAPTPIGHTIYGARSGGRCDLD